MGPRPPVAVLVTGACGDLADSIGRVLRAAYPDIELCGADARIGVEGASVFSRMVQLPLAADDEYISALKQAAKNLAVDLVIPATDPELRRLAADAGACAALPLLVNEPDYVAVFSDKLLTARWLRARALPTPDTMPLAEAAPDLLPLIVKPRRGSGSRGIQVVRTTGELDDIRRTRADDAVAQRYLDVRDAEFTCAVFRVGREERILCMRRWLGGGMTVRAIVDPEPSVVSAVSSLAGALDGDLHINVQLRLTPDGPSIFEINPRFSSTVAMRHQIGFSDLVWSVEGFFGRPVPLYRPPPAGTEMTRPAWNAKQKTPP